MKCCEMSRARERYPSSSQQTTCMRGRRIRCWLGQPRGALREGNDHSMRCAQKKTSHHDRERGKTTIPPTSPAAARKPRERKHHTVEETRAIYQKGSAMARRGNRTPPPAGKGALPSSGRASQEKAGDGANSLSGGGPFRIYDDGGIPPNLSRRRELVKSERKGTEKGANVSMLVYGTLRGGWSRSALYVPFRRCSKETAPLKAHGDDGVIGSSSSTSTQFVSEFQLKRRSRSCRRR